MIEKIQIYPAFNARYYSPYIQGLLSLVGPSKLTYTARGFPRFGTHCLALRIRGEVERKIYIHSDDLPEMDPEGMAWCDLFGKVNLVPELVNERDRSKVLVMGPMFPVRVWGPLAATVRGLSNYGLARTAPEINFRKHMGNYRALYATRFPESFYRPHPSQRDYIFFNAAVWEREPAANLTRARFVEASRSLDGIRFEGGITPRDSFQGTKNFQAPGFEQYVSRRYSPREYFEKTQVSAVVLNNPAYLDCHSWRLAEYLAMGKAIVSTPIIRPVPAPMVHGTHIHIVDGTVESFRAAILQICTDDAYRRTLERNARAYYETYLSPTNVMKRVLGAVGIHLNSPRASRSLDHRCAQAAL